MAAARDGVETKTCRTVFVVEDLPIGEAGFAMFKAHHLPGAVRPICDKGEIDAPALSGRSSGDTRNIGLRCMSALKLKT